MAGGWLAGCGVGASPGERQADAERGQRGGDDGQPSRTVAVSLTTTVVGAARGVAAALGAGCVVRELLPFVCVEEGRCARRSMRTPGLGSDDAVVGQPAIGLQQPHR